MKIKSSIWIIAFAYIVDFIGMWMKITHQAFADFFLTLATVLKVIGVLLFAIFFLRHPKVKEFLEYDQYKDSFK